MDKKTQVFKVESFTEKGVYYTVVVKDKQAICSCPAFQKGKRKPCKHIISLGLAEETEKKVGMYERLVLNSALVKAIRLGKPDLALAVVLKMKDRKFNDFLIKRRVAISAGEDNCNLWWWRKVLTDFSKFSPEEMAVKGALVSKKYNWYLVPEGREHVKAWLIANRLGAIKELEKVDEVSLIRYLLSGVDPWEVLKHLEGLVSPQDIELANRWKRFKDWNIVTILIASAFGHTVDKEMRFQVKGIEPEKRDLKEFSWVFNGIHVPSKAKDQRFSGTWDGMEYMLAMGLKYEELNPDLPLSWEEAKLIVEAYLKKDLGDK